MKLIQKIDVDGVTLTINGENKLAMVQPANSSPTFDVAALPEKQWEAGSKIVALDSQGNTYVFPEDKKFYKDVAVSLRLKSSEYVTDKTRSTVIAKVTNLKDFETADIDFAFSTGSTVTNNQQTSQKLTLNANEFREIEYVIEHENSTYVSATVFVSGDTEDKNNSESLTIPGKTPASSPTINGVFTNECSMVTGYVEGHESQPLVLAGQYETLDNYLINAVPNTNVLKRENLKNVSIKFTNASSVIVWGNSRYEYEDYGAHVLYKRNQDNTSIESSLLFSNLYNFSAENLTSTHYTFDSNTGILTFTESLNSKQVAIFVRPSDTNNCKYQLITLSASIANSKVEKQVDKLTVEGLSQDKYKQSLIKGKDVDTAYSVEYNGFNKYHVNFIGFGDMTGYRITIEDYNSYKEQVRKYDWNTSDDNKYPSIQYKEDYAVHVTLPSNTVQNFKIKGNINNVVPQQGDLTISSTSDGIQVTTTNQVSSTNNVIHDRFTITFEDSPQQPSEESSQTVSEASSDQVTSVSS